MSTNTWLIGQRVLLTFVIGFVAGTAPFIFVQVLPALMTRGTTIVQFSYWAILIVGILIGAIAAIIYAKTQEPLTPRDIFFHSLGIPAVLIATVGNISTDTEAQREIAATNVRATEQIQATPNIKKGEELKRIPEPGNLSRNTSFDKVVLAAVTNVGAATFLAEAISYYVVLGEYHTKAEVSAAYRSFKNRHLQTERYVPKRLSIYQQKNGSFILVYGSYSSREEAIKVYKIIKINDPNIAVSILSN
jgi:hypothetical protein